jgi:hypothetical protein
MPWSKTFQLIVIAATAYGLGLYTIKFTGGGWDWTNAVGLVGCGAVFLFNMVRMLRDFWTPSG